MKKLLTFILSLSIVFAFAQQRQENNKPLPTPGHLPVMTVYGLDGTTLTPSDLVENLVGSGISYSNVSFTGTQGGLATASGGTFINALPIIGIAEGVILCCGHVNNAPGPNSSDGISANIGLPGDADLNAAFGGISTFDATILEFDFVPTSNQMYVQYVFASDEYNEFVGSFNDPFAFFLDGINIALIPTTSVPVSVGTVNLSSYPAYYKNNDPTDFYPNFPYDIEADGFTSVFTATGTVVPNQSHHIKLVIADRNDHNLDSWVFLKAASFSTTNPDVPISNWALYIGIFLILTFAVIRFRRLV
jgi:hypothetical protein